MSNSNDDYTLPTVKAHSLPQSYAPSDYSEKHDIAPYNEGQKDDVVKVEEVRSPSVIRKVVYHHFKVSADCTVGQLKTNSTYQQVFLNQIAHDFKFMVYGNAEVNKLAFLEDEKLPIRYTLVESLGVDEQVFNRNVRNLALSLYIVIAFLAFGFFGFLDSGTDLLFSANVSGGLWLRFMTNLFAFAVCALLYLNYCYHAFAVINDEFTSRGRFVHALKEGDLRAWLPLLYMY
ncbi:hypothetical protein [Vibrio agarivorans]|uniref:hypothetical protein n=1 Tax=Vibrio agarivorans TaxID=153622 RepID=UPI0025B46467|nr:hypothetical protein [Vibrio agarivorans]MDN3661090.1 hypothetical protein [Vibrio agarivorans]